MVGPADSPLQAKNAAEIEVNRRGRTAGNTSLKVTPRAPIRLPWGMVRLPPLAGLTLLFAVSSPAAAAPVEVQGHRGARARFPENTLPAFEHAVQVGADVLELDLLVTKDDRLVIGHDPILDPALCRRTDGPIPAGLAVRSLSYAELEGLDCGGQRHPRFPKQTLVPGTKMPTFEALLLWLKSSKLPGAKTVRLNLEAKSEPTRPELQPEPEAFVALILQALTAHGFMDRVVIQSFDYRILTAVQQKAPQIPTAILISENLLPLVEVARATGARIVSPNHEWVTEPLVKALHGAGVKVVPWTANTPEVWDRLLNWKVDGIITDDPAALLAYLKAKGRRP